MAFYTNFSRAFRTNTLWRSPGDKWQRRACGAPIRFHRTFGKSTSSSENSKRAVKAVLILSNKPSRRGQTSETDSLAKDTERKSFFEVLSIAARIVVIGSVVTGLLVAYIVTRFTGARVYPIILRKCIEFLGPIFIKFGQWASTRRDLFPEDICRTLSQLQRATSPHSWTYTKQLLEAVYGSNWRRVFVKFENEVPIGSGCCAQVYKAWLDPNAPVEPPRNPRVPVLARIAEYLSLGPFLDFIESTTSGREDGTRREEAAPSGRKLQPVAVKILHPGIKEQLRRDLCIMRGICKCATYVAPRLQWLSLPDCIDEFSQIMENQVDLNAEAANLIRFSKNFSTKRDVTFPRPYTNFTRRDVLVESFHEGTPISDYLEERDTEMQGKLARIGIKTILQMVFRDNFIHCDMHPGNILVQRCREPSGSIAAWFWKLIDSDYSPEYPSLVILDCGLVVSLNHRCQQNLRDVFRSVLMGNGELAAEYILEHSSRASPDPDGFKSTLRDIVDAHLRNRRNVNANTVVSELFAAMIRHRVKQDGSFSSVILSMMVIEGLGRSLDPSIDIFMEVVPFVFGSAAAMPDG